ncbi:hypothetical protein NPIL_612321 [Nephila pilipes]|uniref:Uncharacterized protein n=1 Tax=Nephila pilipes TaxID=299642 RepID=A0A8X6TSG1_NEPPI|nr:hypothetical protein NPIL_612321 [Nephila pilipes]
MAGSKLLFLTILAPFFGLISSTCPPASQISPCTCREDNPYGFSVLLCENLTDPEHLLKLARASEGYEFGVVYIRHSNLEYIPKEVLSLIRMKELYLRNVSLNKLFDRPPARPKELKMLTVKKGVIRSGVQWDLFQNLRGLDSLMFSYVPIPVISQKFNQYVDHDLKRVFIDSADTQQVMSGAFKDFTNLETISLRGNQIELLQRDYFPTSFSGKVLRFRDNKLTSLPDNLFTQMPNLNWVDLRNNRLSSLTENTFSNLNKIGISVLLSGNPIKCDRRLKWIADKKNWTLTGTCASPKHLSGKKLKDLQPNDFDS